MFDIVSIKDGLASVDGFYCDGVSAGLKKGGVPDVAFIYSDAPCCVFALFTTNRFAAAPIVHFRQKGEFLTNFVLINSKNANAMTGDEGIRDIDEVLLALKRSFPQIQNPIMSSTGVIGVRLPKEKIIAAASTFDLSAKNSAQAARAIMTTDAFPKEIALRVTLQDGRSFGIAGIAKGAGMINPAMATMLCFIVTDAAVPAGDMQELLTAHVATTFNAISVDGDTSTNDTVMLLANQKSGVYDKEAFSESLRLVMHHLALLIAKDGEGAKKLVGFDVKGATTNEEAQKAAKALTNSLLVKTALHGEDPNWGRIASTIGASGIECDPKTLTIAFEEVVVYERGRILFDKETEAKAAAVMKKEEFTITCDIGLGEGRFKAYGCDLGHEYVTINADYRT